MKKLSDAMVELLTPIRLGEYDPVFLALIVGRGYGSVLQTLDALCSRGLVYYSPSFRAYLITEEGDKAWQKEKAQGRAAIDTTIDVEYSALVSLLSSFDNV